MKAILHWTIRGCTLGLFIALAAVAIARVGQFSPNSVPDVFLMLCWFIGIVIAIRSLVLGIWFIILEYREQRRQARRTPSERWR